jgi:hypothetical protein
MHLPMLAAMCTLYPANLEWMFGHALSLAYVRPNPPLPAYHATRLGGDDSDIPSD